MGKLLGKVSGGRVGVAIDTAGGRETLECLYL